MPPLAIPGEYPPKHPKAGRTEHPLFDLEHWLAVAEAELASGRKEIWKETPVGLALLEQDRAEALRLLGRPLEASAVVDQFVWAMGPPAKPYLTKIGGLPHRERSRPWPKNTTRKKKGEPLQFVCQWCFADSLDLVGELPGEVLLLFVSNPECPWAEEEDGEDICLGWSSMAIREETRPEDAPPPTGIIPIVSGEIHRTMSFGQVDLDLYVYSSREEGKEVFSGREYNPKYVKPNERGVPSGVSWKTPATVIGAESDVPQGDPCSRGEKLLCTLNYLQVPASFGTRRPDVERWYFTNVETLGSLSSAELATIPELIIGDLGMLTVIQRARRGRLPGAKLEPADFRFQMFCG